MSDPGTDLDYLSNISQFWGFLAWVYRAREQCIADLGKAPDAGKVMEISGKVQAYDDILVAANWELIRDRMTRQ